MLKKTLLILVLIVFLPVCTAWAFIERDEEEDDPTQPPTPQPVEKTRIVAFGDSITRGYGATPYSVFLQQQLDANGCNSVVINEGKDAETTIDGVYRFGSVLNNRKPNYILIMEGANDARIGVSSNAIVANLGSMMDQAGAAGAVPIVSAVTPNTEGGSENRTIPDVINPAIANAAASRGVRYVDNYNALAGPNWGSYNFDGLHMTTAGQQVLASQFLAVLPCGGSGGSGGSGGGGGCFIATAAYGSLLEPHVALLREFRDSFLLTNGAGKKFVSLYYTYSPPLAAFIAERESLQMIVRVVLLPLIGISYLLVNGLWYLVPVAMAAICLLGIAGIRLRELRSA
jgi:lysophospholipase L1-like esterase